MEPPSNRAPNLLARARAYVHALAREHSSPGRLFAACVVGAIVGSTPFFGLHFFLCVGLAVLFRLNRVVVYGAANISIPPLAPFLALACIDVGSRLLHGRTSGLAAATLRDAHPWTMARDLFLAWVVGAPVVGGAIGVVLGLVVARVARKTPRTDDPFAVVAQSIVARFPETPRWARHYVRWKVRLDPVYRSITAELPERCEIVEIGCGLGIFPLLCAELSAHRRIVAMDRDGAKIALARVACAGLPIELEEADVRTWAPPPCDVLLVVDVLHYFDDETQAAILRRAADALRPNGTLFVREGEGAARSSAWTRMLERIAVAVRWNRSDARPNFRPIAALEADLRLLGFETERIPTAGRFHPGNVLLRATRPSC